ncbi:MAG: fumarylacetoacetate hydrolase family protein [Ottowia sp.]|uniref:fumarylacetoacetate hydrolase family protein n=1 Tax=Ottowia sp. TaxID=1898956 RepID=UPI003C7421E0
MKLATIDKAGRAVPAVLTADAAYDLQVAIRTATPEAVCGSGIIAADSFSMLDLIASGDKGLAFARHVLEEPGRFHAARVPQSEVRLLAPIPRTPRNVFCLGRNYAEHIREDNVSREKDTSLPQYPQFFTKPASAIIGPDAGIRYDEKVTRRLDYEVELAVVIGKGGRDIKAEDAFKHVFGYTIVNDITARDLQKRHDQWFKGKALDTSCPMGPYIVTADEIKDPHALRIELDVNGEPRQIANTGDMIFKIPQTIESLSSGLTLEPGDVIATGTPSGVGYAMNPRQWLKVGDVITCRLEGVGTLSNPVVGP